MASTTDRAVRAGVDHFTAYFLATINERDGKNTMNRLTVSSKLRCRFLTSTNPERDDDAHGSKRSEVMCCVVLQTKVDQPGFEAISGECFQTMERPISALMIDEAHVIEIKKHHPTFQLFHDQEPIALSKP